MRSISGADSGRAHPARAPLKLEKIWIFGVKSWFFTRNTPKIFAPPSPIEKNMIFWRKIVIFHTKYPKNLAPPFARRNFFKCPLPLTWNPGSAPEYQYLLAQLIDYWPERTKYWSTRISIKYNINLRDVLYTLDML